MKMQILDCDYVVVNGKPVVRLFCKDEDGKAVCAFYDKYLPYFYLDIGDRDIADVKFELEQQHISFEIVERFLPIGYQEKPKKVFKIIGRDPSKTPEVREWSRKFGVPYEADILFKYRFMTDFGLKGMGWIEVEGKTVHTKTVKCPAIEAETIRPIEVMKNIPFRYLAIDTETVVVEKSGLADYARDPITMISMRFYPEHKGKKDVVLLAKNTIAKDCIICNSEKDMMTKFKEILLDYDPDIIVGYNIENYDMPYILKRMEVLNVHRDIGRSEKFPYTRNAGKSMRTNISGRVIIDPYFIIRYLTVYDQPHKFKRYDLGTVSRKILKKDKIEVGGWRGMAELWKGTDEQVAKFIEYCKNDSVLALELVTSHKLVDMDKFIEMAKLCGLLLEDLMLGQSARHEAALLHELRKRNILMPCKPARDTMSERLKYQLKGATVLEPEIGFHKDGAVLVLDFTSLYPSLMIAYNICPTTLITDPGNLPHNKSPYGSCFVKEEIKQGLMPYISKYLLSSRAALRKQMKTERDPEMLRFLDAKQYAFKGMAVSLYGYNAFSGGKLYTPDVAAAITSYGRENIEFTKKLVEENFDVKVVYGDSITKDRFVTILDNGVVKIKNIEELFNENKHKLFLRGDKETIKLSGIKALSVNPKTLAPVWSDINEIIRHKTKKKVFKLNQKLGETVATEDHSIMSMSDNTLTETKTEDMINKSMIRVGAPSVNKFDVVDVYEILKDYKKEIKYKGRKKIAVVHKDSKYVWFGWTNRKSNVKIKRFIRGKDLDSLFRLLGLYIAEGSSSTIETTSSRSGASIALSDVTILKQLENDYNNLFENVQTSIIKSTQKERKLKYKILSGEERNIIYNDKTHKLQMMNELSAIFFKMFCGQTSHAKKIPEIAYHVSVKHKQLLLEYMIKGDGSKWADKRYSKSYILKNFRYDTSSLQLISGLSFLLNQLKMKYTIRYDSKKKTYRITTCTAYNKPLNAKLTEEKYTGYVYDLSVNGTHMFVDSCGQILLHNTDSLFVKTNISDLDMAEQLGNEIAKFVTERLHGLDLKFEKLFRRFLILSKKRYAGWSFEKVDGVWKDKLAMKGIETVRRDWCFLTTSTMEKVIETILKEGDIKKASKLVRDTVININKGLVSLDDLTVVKGVSKEFTEYDGIQPHVELAKKMLKRDPTRTSMVGERLGYVIIRGNQMLSMRAEDPAYVKEKNLQIDSDYYVTSQLLPPIERIFEVCGISSSELLEGSRQKTLSGILGSRADEIILDSFESVVCKKCHWESHRPTLSGHCPDCNSSLFFSGNGNVSKIVEFK